MKSINLPNSFINSVKTPGSLSIRHQLPAESAMFHLFTVNSK